MRGYVIALVLVAASAAHAQNRCAHGSRDALIGAAIGATLSVAVIIRVPPGHEPPPRRITSTRGLMETWFGAWGAGLGATVALAPRHECGRWPAGHRDAAGRCGAAVRNGALQGGASIGALGFLLSPVLALPVLMTASPAKPVNLDHIMGLFTLGGAAIGAPVVAIKRARECHAS